MNKQLYWVVIGGLWLALAGCTTQPARTLGPDELRVEQQPVTGSHFHQVSAHFMVPVAPDAVLKFLSNTARVPEWMQYVDRVTVLSYYDHSHFLLRTVMQSPWPFAQRELISCVNTQVSPERIVIDVKHCGTRVPLRADVVRVSDLASRWEIVSNDQGGSQVRYVAWLEPGGWVPAWVFNSQLMRTTRHSIRALMEQLSF